jgi:hypothetical protein
MAIHEEEQYSAPQVRLLGSVEEMTNQEFDKVGRSLDAFSTAQNMLTGIVKMDP